MRWGEMGAGERTWGKVDLFESNNSGLAEVDMYLAVVRGEPCAKTYSLSFVQRGLDPDKHRLWTCLLSRGKT